MIIVCLQIVQMVDKLQEHGLVIVMEPGMLDF
jgi:hypothetical protein